MKEITHKQRFLNALKCKQIDYIPCSIYFNSNLRVKGYNLPDEQERIRLQLDLGTTPTVGLNFPHAVHKEVKTATWTDTVKGEQYPISWQKHTTPEGELTHGLRLAYGWDPGNAVPVMGDHAASNCFEPLIKQPEDAKKLKWLFMPPGEEEFRSCEERIKKARELSEKYTIPVQGYAGWGLATLIFLMGAQNAIYFAMDYPEALKEIAEIDHKINMKNIELCKRAGCDFLKRFGGYEMTNFFNVTIFEEVVLPLLKDEAELARSLDIPIYYRVVSGMKPVLPLIAQAGFDCIEGFEPALTDCTNQDIKNAFNGNTCIWTGVSSPGHIGHKDDTLVRKAVRDAVETFGNRGFILGVTNSIRNHWKWENTLAMIDEWKKIR